MLPKCNHCGAYLEIVKTSMFRQARWHCYGCEIKSRCDKPNGDDGCWFWRGTMRGRYGVLWVIFNRKRYMRNAHRVAYAVWRGSIEKSWAVLHSCSEPTCCNPAHLYLEQQPLAISGAPMDLELGPSQPR